MQLQASNPIGRLLTCECALLQLFAINACNQRCAFRSKRNPNTPKAKEHTQRSCGRHAHNGLCGLMVTTPPSALFQCHFDMDTQEEIWVQSLPRVFNQVVSVIECLVLDALAADQPCFGTLAHGGFDPTILRQCKSSPPP